MKRSFIVSILLLATVAVWSQSRSIQIPLEVEDGFMEKYPNIIPLGWKQTKQKAYKAYFNLEGEKAIAYFTPAGKWYRTMLYLADPPYVVEDYIAREYTEPEIKKITRSESPKEKITFRLSWIPGLPITNSISVRREIC